MTQTDVETARERAHLLGLKAQSLGDTHVLWPVHRDDAGNARAAPIMGSSAGLLFVATLLTDGAASLLLGTACAFAALFWIPGIKTNARYAKGPSLKRPPEKRMPWWLMAIVAVNMFNISGWDILPDAVVEALRLPLIAALSIGFAWFIWHQWQNASHARKVWQAQ